MTQINPKDLNGQKSLLSNEQTQSGKKSKKLSPLKRMKKIPVLIALATSIGGACAGFIMATSTPPASAAMIFKDSHGNEYTIENDILAQFLKEKIDNGEMYESWNFIASYYSTWSGNLNIKIGDHNKKVADFNNGNYDDTQYNELKSAAERLEKSINLAKQMELYLKNNKEEAEENYKKAQEKYDGKKALYDKTGVRYTGNDSTTAHNFAVDPEFVAMQNGQTGKNETIIFYTTNNIYIGENGQAKAYEALKSIPDQDGSTGMGLGNGNKTIEVRHVESLDNVGFGVAGNGGKGEVTFTFNEIGSNSWQLTSETKNSNVGNFWVGYGNPGVAPTLEEYEPKSLTPILTPKKGDISTSMSDNNSNTFSWKGYNQLGSGQDYSKAGNDSTIEKNGVTLHAEKSGSETSWNITLTGSTNADVYFAIKNGNNNIYIVYCAPSSMINNGSFTVPGDSSSDGVFLFSDKPADLLQAIEAEKQIVSGDDKLAIKFAQVPSNQTEQ